MYQGHIKRSNSEPSSYRLHYKDRVYLAYDGCIIFKRVSGLVEQQNSKWVLVWNKMALQYLVVS